MAKEPKDRFESVEAFAETLEAALAVKPPPAPFAVVDESAAPPSSEEPPESDVETQSPKTLVHEPANSANARWAIALALVVLAAAVAWFALKG